MKTRIRCLLLMLLTALMATSCSPTAPSSSPQSSNATNTTSSLRGAWRSQIRFSNGSFAKMKDLEFMYAFNEAGTMTESSNYDAAPPVPPAYGVWKAIAPGEFEAKYFFYITAPPKKFDEIVQGGGWGPSGHGEFIEKIKLSSDGRSYNSTIDYTSFDNEGKPAADAGQATGSGTRIAF